MGLNLQNLSDEELDLLESRLNQQQPSTKTQSAQFPEIQQQTNLQNLSDKQLKQLEQQFINEEARERFLNPEPIRPTQTGLSGLESPEEVQPAFGGGELGTFFRGVAAPVVGLVPDILQTLRNIQRGGADVFSKFVGLPTNEDIQERTGIAPSELPFTTENLQKTFDQLTDGQFKDSPDNIKLANNIVRDTALLFTPLGPVRGQQFLRSLGTSIFSNLGAKGLVSAGMIDEDNEDLTKLGLMFTSSFIRPVSIRGAARRFLNDAERSIQNVVVTDTQAANELREVARNLRRAGGVEVNPRAINFVEGLIADVESGTFEADTVTRAVRNLNRLIRRLGPTSDEALALGNVRRGLQNIAERIGQSRPEFIRNWNEGNQLFQAANTRNFISEWARNRIPNEFLRRLPLETLSLLGLGVVKGKLAPIALGANITMNAFTRLARFPAVQRLYGRFIQEALSNNVQAATRTLDQIKKAFEQTEEANKPNQIPGT